MADKDALIIGTAAMPNVEHCLRDFHSVFPDHMLHAFLKSGTALDTSLEVVVHHFEQTVHTHSLGLFLHFRRIRPSRVVIACNKVFFHHNVLRAVKRWSWMCHLTPKVSVFLQPCLLFDGLKGMLPDDMIDF